MAKGKRHGAERLLGAAPNHSGGAGGGRDHSSADLSDLHEDDVWTAFRPATHEDSAVANDDDDEGGTDPGRLTSRALARRWLQRHEAVGGLTLAFEDAHGGASPIPQTRERHRVAGSAPVDVPAWPSLLGSGSMEPPAEREEEEEDSADGDWLPPHEYLARVRGRSMATSVLEGAGRTLKGRDMSRVRDAVWNQTGFLG